MVDKALVDLDYSDRVPSRTSSESKVGQFSLFFEGIEEGVLFKCWGWALALLLLI